MEIKLDWAELHFQNSKATIKDKVFLLKAVLIQTHQSLRSSAFVYHQGLKRLSQGRSFFRRNEQLIWNCLRSQSRHRTKTVCFSEIRIYSFRLWAAALLWHQKTVEATDSDAWQTANVPRRYGKIWPTQSVPIKSCFRMILRTKKVIHWAIVSKFWKWL